MRVLLLMLFVTILASCGRQDIINNNEDLNYSRTCKADFRHMYCKYISHKNKVTYCAKIGDGSHAVPCEFYEDL